MNTKEQVLAFFEKCNELKSCKFIMATTKIKDILKCIVNSPDLYRLFEEVTSNFNYPKAKSQCLVTVNDGIYDRGYCVLPQTIGERIAFVFCILVEFDMETLNFNDFLRQYFPEDGSYFASYHAFCNTVIKGLQDAVAVVFKDELDKPLEVTTDAESSNSAKAEYISAINLAISEEKQYLATNANIPDDEKEGAFEMLTQLFGAVKQGNVNLINALICGYNYFVMYHKCVSDGVGALIGQIAAFEQIL